MKFTRHLQLFRKTSASPDKWLTCPLSAFSQQPWSWLLSGGQWKIVAGEVVDFTEGLSSTLAVAALVTILKGAAPRPVAAYVGEFGIFTMAVAYGIGLLLPLVLAFTCCSPLEDSGYLPRLAVLLDNTFRLSLNGKAVIPNTGFRLRDHGGNIHQDAHNQAGEIISPSAGTGCSLFRPDGVIAMMLATIARLAGPVWIADGHLCYGGGHPQQDNARPFRRFVS